MEKILVILTGGTIGSKSENGTVDVSSAAAYKIVSLYFEKFGKDVDFDVVQPVNFLSENMNIDIWLELCRCIDSTDISKYSGIIICHGSDTLSYTSALIGMLYSKLPLPVVLVAANYELGNSKSNGMDNFRSAVCLIKENVRGVFVSYGNKKRDIYIATRIVESDPYLDEYRSFDGKPWGEIVNDRLVVNMKPSVEELKNFKPVINSKPLDFDRRVMLLRSYPGLDYDSISIDNVSAVVHYMYHSATACTIGESTSVIKFAKRCREKGVRLYMASFKDRSVKRAYKSSRDILNEGVIPMFNISLEAAYVKALICENMKTDIDESFYFECL